jgi:hypothetical protein
MNSIHELSNKIGMRAIAEVQKAEGQ